MTDYDPYIRSFDSVAPSLATTSLDDNPDDGAKALQLSRATGVAPKVVYGDLDGFQQEHRANLAAGLIRNNSALAEYIRGNTLADVVSNDDYGNLDTFSRSVPRAIKPLVSVASAGISGAYQGAKEALTAPYEPSDIEAYMKAGKAQQLVYSAGDIAGRLMNAFGGAISGGAAEAAKQTAREVGADDVQVERAGREVRGIVESEMMRTGEHEGPRPFEAAKADAIAAAKPWIDAGKEPPRGVHPDIDAAKAELNSTYLEQLDANLKDAQASLTRERDPELFQKFAEQHYGDSTIGISGDRVVELYGDKLPTPDDGLLGWVPGIESKMEAARLGEDVHVPLADWMTRVDPAIAKDLHDDLRVWPGGITANEAKEPWAPKPVVESPIAQTREAGGLEPVFAIGDKKLTLQRDVAMEGFEQFHDYHMLDQDGSLVGRLEILPDEAKKQLYVANINGLAGLYSNSFGPSLVRDLKRQLKEIYPDYETITGHRVSGAREEAGTWEEPSAHPVVKLALDEAETYEGFNDFHDMLESGYLKAQGHGVYSEPADFHEPRQAEVAAAIHEEVQKISGVAPEITGGIYTAQGSRPTGVYFPDTGRILVDLYSEDPIGYGRHEAIHHLYRQGFFAPEEWTGLINAARSEGWLDRYGIKDRYPDLDIRGQYEESIAEAYRDWATHRDEVEQPTTLVTQAFEKIRQLWENIQTRLKEIFGRELSPDELFKKVESGEVAGRDGEPRSAASPAFALDDKAKLDNLRAGAAGLDSKTFERMQKLIQTRFKEDLDASLRRAEADQKRTQTKEWKEASKDLAKEVEGTIRQRPDVMADMLVGSGEFAGKKLRQRYPLRAEDLTPEQKAGLPRHYYSADGLPVDGVAKMVGFTSGDAMIEKLVEYNKDKGNLSSNEHLQKVIANETERQMQAKFGDLQKNIMLDAEDQALSENNLNILAEEWQGAAMAAGVKVVDKDFATEHAKGVFAKMEMGTVDTGRLLTQMSKHYRDATNSLIGGKSAEALGSLQRRFEIGVIAAEAKKLEKERKAFDKTAKQFAKREVPSVDTEYTPFIHQILTQVGKPVRRSMEDIEKQIGAGEAKDLEEFVENKTAALREVPVWDQLYDRGWKKSFDALTTEEFRNVHNSIKALVANGRDEMKIERAGEAADYAAIKAQLIDNIAESVGREVRAPKKPGLLRSYLVRNLQMENIFNRWDAFDPKGVWNQYVMRDLVDGANEVDKGKKEYAARLKDLGTPKDLHKAIDNPLFKDMDHGTTIPFTRKNLIAVMLNTGTKSNLVKLAKGYDLSPDAVMAWVHDNATKEEWDFTRGVWGVFKDIKSRSDVMYRSLTGGVAAEDVPGQKIQTAFGEIQGGYYPVIFHPEMEGKSKKLMGGLEQENYVRASTPAGYTKSRTGYVAPLSLDMDQMPGRISQMIHDIELRKPVLNAAKVFYDKEIRSAIRKYYGDEYKQEMIPYLKAVANSSNREERPQAAFTRAGEFIRQNMITTLVGLNPGTVLKHGPSAMVTSMREVGPAEFAKAVTGLLRVNDATGDTNWQFAIKNSLELQRRDRNWQETLFGATSSLTPDGKYPEWRQRIMEWSSKPVAMSDMLSAVPTWMAAYEKEMATSGIHGDAVYAADRAVRRAHGSTAITSRTAIQRDWNPWLTSVYNFFSDIMNRQMETIWRAGEIKDLVKDGDRKGAMKAAGGFTASLFAYAVWPAIVENLVSGGEPEDEKKPWAYKAAKQMTQTASSSWPGVRDLVNGIVYGKDPQYGLTGTAYQEVANAFRDLGKDHPFAKEHAGKLLQDAAGFVGEASGLVPLQVGKSARFLHDVKTGQEHPRGAWSWLTGMRFGTTKGHSTSAENWWKGVAR